MNTKHTILEGAISDVGYWSWWAEELPKVFQVEFGGTQFWNPPSSSDAPPSGQIALRFNTPKFISFLTKEDSPESLPSDWNEMK